jgi:hypothetical protein
MNPIPLYDYFHNHNAVSGAEAAALIWHVILLGSLFCIIRVA